MNFGFSGEMIFIFFLALILFGPKKMPEIGRQVARLLNEFRRASNEFRAQIESEVNALDMGGKTGGSTARQQILPPLQAPLGSLANRIFHPPSGNPPSGTFESASLSPVSAEKPELPENATVNGGALPAGKVAPDA